MHPSHPTLPTSAKVTIEVENSSTYFPSGMLDRDQRTTKFRSENCKKYSTNHLCQLSFTTINKREPSTHFSHHKHQSISSTSTNTNANIIITNTNTSISEKCKHFSQQTKDNNTGTVMFVLTKNLRKAADFNRSRTKFPLVFQIIAWVIFFSVNFTYSNAGPIRGLTECSTILNETIGYNRDQTNFSMAQLAVHMKYYQLITNTSDEVVSDWSHHAGNIGETNIEALFDKKPFMDVFKENLQKMYDNLFNVAEHFNFFHCMHSNVNFTGRTTHNMNLDENKNNLIKSYLDEIHSYTNLSIIQIKDASRDLDLQLDFKDITDNCTLHNNTSVVREIVIMKKLEGILKYMSGFFDYIENKICK